MHKLAQWSTKRSGVNVVVTGINEDGQAEKHQCSEVAGPDETRVALPQYTIAWRLKGEPIILVTDFSGIII
jgi:hypothetical protein